MSFLLGAALGFGVGDYVKTEAAQWPGRRLQQVAMLTSPENDDALRTL